MANVLHHSEFLGRRRHKEALGKMLGREIISGKDELEALREVAYDNPPLGHFAKCVGVTQDDQVICECGWESTVLWDGAEWAWDEWTNHMADVLGLKPLEPGG